MWKKTDFLAAISKHETTSVDRIENTKNAKHFGIKESESCKIFLKSSLTFKLFKSPLLSLTYNNNNVYFSSVKTFMNEKIGEGEQVYMGSMVLAANAK